MSVVTFRASQPCGVRARHTGTRPIRRVGALPATASHGTTNRWRRLRRPSFPVASSTPSPGRNVLGDPLQPCSVRPLTGFFRTGCCDTGTQDLGLHVVCAVMTEEFLAFSRSRGNDLVTPVPEVGFPGLQAGDRWCLALARWVEALEAGIAPRIVLAATHEAALESVPLDILLAHAIDIS